MLFELIQRDAIAGLRAEHALDGLQQALLDLALLHLIDQSAFEELLEQPQEPLQCLDVLVGVDEDGPFLNGGKIALRGGDDAGVQDRPQGRLRRDLNGGRIGHRSAA